MLVCCYCSHRAAPSSLLSLALLKAKATSEKNFNDAQGSRKAVEYEDDGCNRDEEDNDDISGKRMRPMAEEDSIRTGKRKKSKGTKTKKTAPTKTTIKKKRRKGGSQRYNSGSYRSKGRKYNNYATKFTNGAMKLTKYSFKNVFDLVSPKNVNLKQVIGKWKMSQEIQVTPTAAIISCPATIEFLGNGSVVTSFDGIVYISEYKFTEKTWPHYCKIQFSAHAFQGPRDKEPRKMLYKGYFKKSLMNSGLIMMRGKVYMFKGKLWKSSVKCGKFKATFKSRGSTKRLKQL